LTLQSHFSEQEARVRRALSSIEQAENRALRDIFVKDSPPIWNLQTSLGTEWHKQSGDSFSSELKASIAFTKRLPFTFLIHALFVALMASALHWMRRRIKKLAEEKPDLERALPILDLPVSTALALSMLLVPFIYEQAPRLIHAIMGAVTLIPTVVILRRLMERHSYPLLNAVVIMYFVGQLRILTASLPVLSRFIFLGQMLGAAIFLVWVLRRWHLPAQAADTHGRIWRTIRAIAKIGIIVLLAALLANIFGYVNFNGNHISQERLHRGYAPPPPSHHRRLAHCALQVRPLGSLRVIHLHRPMIQRPTCRVLEFLAFLLWLNVLLSFSLRFVHRASIGESKRNPQSALQHYSANPQPNRGLGFLSSFSSYVCTGRRYHHCISHAAFHTRSQRCFTMSSALGFFCAWAARDDLTKVTILAGAFSVGIGFIKT
jgi:hypothetical protein